MISDSVLAYARSQYGRIGVSPGDVVLDLGAHVGSFAAVAAELGAQKVVAVEANPRTCELLRQNAEARLGVILPVWAAVVHDSYDGPTTTLYCSTRTPTATTDSTTRRRGVPVTVPVARLADLIREYAPTAVKMDIEGTELLIFAGAVPEMSSVRKLGVEFHHKGLDVDIVPFLQDLFMRMEEAGWTAVNKPASRPPTSSWPLFGFWRR